MSDQSLIGILEIELNAYPEIEFDRPNFNELIIYCNDDNGISISLLSKEGEFKLNFNEWSKYFDKLEDCDDEISELIINVLTGKARLEEYSKNDHPYKWNLQLQDKNGDWYSYGVPTIIANLNFGTKPQIRYLQNDTSKLKRICQQKRPA